MVLTAKCVRVCLAGQGAPGGGGPPPYGGGPHGGGPPGPLGAGNNPNPNMVRCHLVLVVCARACDAVCGCCAAVCSCCALLYQAVRVQVRCPWFTSFINQTPLLHVYAWWFEGMCLCTLWPCFLALLVRLSSRWRCLLACCWLNPLRLGCYPRAARWSSIRAHHPEGEEEAAVDRLWATATRRPMAAAPQVLTPALRGEGSVVRGQGQGAGAGGADAAVRAFGMESISVADCLLAGFFGQGSSLVLAQRSHTQTP
jgi:hypothetical protein